MTEAEMSDAAEGDDLARAKLRLGTVLRGKYRLDRVLGIGGMATVYAATHRNGNEFAVKMLHPELSTRTELRSRFLREGRAAGTVKHTGVVMVLDDDIAEDGSAFLVMELLQGETIEGLWERQGQRLPWMSAVEIGVQLLDVLAAAHASGVVHRDIKPANLFLTRQGQLKILDFGIARVRDGATSHATRTGLMMGTPAFMAPEQALGKTSDVDAQTDVWAVGATLFTLVSGRVVHEGENAQQIVIRAATMPAPALASLMPDLPARFSGIVDRALAYDKATRWESAAAMRDALQGLLQRASTGQPHSLSQIGEAATVFPSISSPHSGQAPAQGLAKFVVRPISATPPAPAPVGGPVPGPPGSMTTARPVLADPGTSPAQANVPWRRPARVAAVAGIVALGAAGALVALGRSSGPTTAAAAAGAASAVVSGAEPTVLGVPATSVAAAPITEALTPATVTAAASSAPAAPRTTPGTAQPAATAPAPPRPSPAVSRSKCDPPYELDASGGKKWKRECLR
jgi:serine/threonine protein kinase